MRNPFIRKKRESSLERHVGVFCAKHDILYWKFTSPSRNGVPDRILIGRGKVAFLELKTGNNKLTVLQLHQICNIKTAGVPATWCNNYEDICSWIRETFQL